MHFEFFYRCILYDFSNLILSQFVLKEFSNINPLNAYIVYKYIKIMAQFFIRCENHVISFENVKWQSVASQPFCYVHQVFIKRFSQLTQILTSWKYIGVISKQYGKTVSWFLDTVAKSFI